jgi:putative colanic acid biosynthesis acetyltransferase WcaF
MHDLPVIDLRLAGNADGVRGRSRLIQGLWLLTETLVVSNPLVPSSQVRAFALRLFGARVGQGVVLRPRLRVKYPWKLIVGDYAWVGEGVWIDNHDSVKIGPHAVLSQEAYLTTGSHDLERDMRLVMAPIEIGPGAWVTARAIVTRGVRLGTNAVVTPGSVVVRDVPDSEVHGGNPAHFIKMRSSKSQVAARVTERERVT